MIEHIQQLRGESHSEALVNAKAWHAHIEMLDVLCTCLAVGSGFAVPWPLWLCGLLRCNAEEEGLAARLCNMQT